MKKNLHQLQYHPLAEVFPMLPEKEIEILAEDIKGNGLHVPIILYQGKILDGRNRYKACLLAGVEPITESWENLPESTHTTPEKWVISINLIRRQLTDSQRAMVAAELADREPGRQSKAAQHSMTQPEAGAAMLVSQASLKRATAIRKRGVPELIEAVKSGKIKLNPAYQ